MTATEVEARIIELLHAGPMTQADIVDAFPLDHYYLPPLVLRDMEKRGLVTREKYRNTKMVTALNTLRLKWKKAHAKCIVRVCAKKRERTPGATTTCYHAGETPSR